MIPTLLLLAQLAAFPGAMGGGAQSVGGRGGVVMEVTNTNTSGTGSLPNCVQATGPRTCVFRIAGIFPNGGTAGSPYLTVACQTAPGEVIIGGPNVVGGLRISTHDVILRYCMVSPDSTSIASGPDTGTVGLLIANCGGDGTLQGGGCYNIITDHVTTRWSGNKSWIAESNFTPGLNGNGNGDGPNHNITVQWHLDYEPHEGHPVGYGTATDESCVGTRADPKCLSVYETNIDFHHNMFVNVNHRIPENSNGSTRWDNNIVWNYGFYANAWLGAEIIDARNNKYSSGPLGKQNGAQTFPIHFTTNSPEMSGAPSVYVSGNILGGYGVNTPAADQYGTLVNQITGENGAETGPIPASWERSAPMADTPFPIIVDPVANLDAELTTGVGAFQHVGCDGSWVNHQDPQDARIINQYKTGGPGGFWPNGVTFSGQTNIPTPTANWTDTPNTNFTPCVESLHDGIPDQWKKAKGLSTTDTGLFNKLAPDGYTWLEEYINAGNSSSSGGGNSVPPIPPQTPSASGSTVTPTSGGSLIDSAGNTWTLNSTNVTDPTCQGTGNVCGTQIVLNGTAQAGTAASLLLYFNGVVYSENTVPLWWDWVGGAWVKVAGDPRPATPPPPPAPTVTCTPTSVQMGGTVTCTANQIITTWTASAGTIRVASSEVGVLTASSTAGTTTVTGTNANGSGTATVTVTAPPPTNPTFTINVSVAGTSIATLTCTWSTTTNAYSCQ